MNANHISTAIEFSQKILASQVRITVVFIVVIILYGCERDAEPGNDVGTNAKSTYQEPADGKLTEKQVVDYIVIRKKIIRDVNAQKIAAKTTLEESSQKSTTSSDVRYFDEIERQVAHSYSMSYDEFLWIKDTVISTQTTLLVQQYYDLNNRIMTLLDKTLTRYKEINANNNDQQEQRIMDGYVEEMKRDMASLREIMPGSNGRVEALGHNVVIISKFKNELESLEQQAIQRIAPE